MRTKLANTVAEFYLSTCCCELASPWPPFKIFKLFEFAKFFKFVLPFSAAFCYRSFAVLRLKGSLNSWIPLPISFSLRGFCLLLAAVFFLSSFSGEDSTMFGIWSLTVMASCRWNYESIICFLASCMAGWSAQLLADVAICLALFSGGECWASILWRLSGVCFVSV